MAGKSKRVQDAMANGKAVDDEPFDPSKIAGDDEGKAKRRRRTRTPKAEVPPAEPPINDSEHDSDGPGDNAPDYPDDTGEWEPDFGEMSDDQRLVELAIAKLCAEFDQNDAGNGQRLILWFGPNLAYVSGLGWLTWRGTHWQRDEGELEARRWCQLLVEKIKMEPVHLIATDAQQRVLDMAARHLRIDYDDRTPAQHDTIERAAAIRKELNSRRSKRRNFAVSSGNAGKTAAMLQQAASFKSIDQKLLDANHSLFNVLNGTLEFSRIPDPEQDLDGADIVQRMVGHVDIRDASRDDMITKLAEVTYDPAALCAEWHKFLERMMPDEKMRRFLQVFHAYAILIGGNGAQKIAYHFGLGGNGKSAFLETLGALAGSYRSTVSPETITGDGAQRQGQQASPDIARLHNTRLVVVEELPKGVPLRENLVKAMSGGSPLTARFLQKEFFEFIPIFTAVLSGNTKPSITGSDRGIWRRVFIIHWEVSMAEDDPDRVEFPELMKRFAAERSGILNWLIEGALLYLQHGLMHFVPPKVKAFTEEYRRDRDNVEVFAEAMIVPREGNRIQAGHLYKKYVEWCEVNGITAAKQRSFGDRLSELGFKKETGRVYEYLDITLRAAPTVLSDEPPEDDPNDPGWSPT